MADTRITDLVDPEEIKKLQELDAELRTVLDTYTKVAKDLAQGLEINIKVAGDIERLEKLLVDKGKEAAEAQQNLTNVMRQQGEAIANTTNTISRHLMEQERVNKTTRAAYTEQEKVNKLLEHFHDTYENQIDSFIRINRQLEENKKKQKENEQALKAGRMSAADFAKAQADLMILFPQQFENKELPISCNVMYNENTINNYTTKINLPNGFEGGKKYTYTITVINNSIVIENANITSWGIGTDNERLDAEIE